MFPEEGNLMLLILCKTVTDLICFPDEGRIKPPKDWIKELHVTLPEMDYLHNYTK